MYEYIGRALISILAVLLIVFVLAIFEALAGEKVALITYRSAVAIPLIGAALWIVWQ